MGIKRTMVQTLMGLAVSGIVLSTGITGCASESAESGKGGRNVSAYNHIQEFSMDERGAIKVVFDREELRRLVADKQARLREAGLLSESMTPVAMDVTNGDGSVVKEKPGTTSSSQTTDTTVKPVGTGAVENTEAGMGTAVGYTFEKMGETTMYIKSMANVRDTPSSTGNKVGKLSKGDEVVVTGKCVETGWYRIVVDGKEMYVSDTLVTAEKPATSSQGTTSAGTTQQGTGTTTQTQQGNGSTTQTQAGTTTQTTSTSNDVSTAFIDYLNQQRAAAGLSQVSWDAGLAAGAKARAVEISEVFDHDLRFNALENIGSIQSGSVSDWFNLWNGSDIHRQTMFNPNLTSAAAAYYEVDGYYYIVFLSYYEVPVMSADEWNAAKDGGEYNQLESIEGGDGWNSYGTEGVEIVTDEDTEADVEAALRDAGLL